MRVRKRVTKMVVTVSIIYGLCWTPDIVIFASILFGSKFALGDAADITSIVLVACNSTVNSIIYAYVNDYFRNKIKALLCGTGRDGNRVHPACNMTMGRNMESTAKIVKREVQLTSVS